MFEPRGFRDIVGQVAAEDGEGIGGPSRQERDIAGETPACGGSGSACRPADPIRSGDGDGTNLVRVAVRSEDDVPASDATPV